MLHILAFGKEPSFTFAHTQLFYIPCDVMDETLYLRMATSTISNLVAAVSERYFADARLSIQ